MAPETIVASILRRLKAAGAERNYRHYSSWASVQMTLSFQFKKSPSDKWSEEVILPCDVLERRGLGFDDFVEQSVSQPLKKLGISMWLFRITEMSVHHYRRNK